MGTRAGLTDEFELSREEIQAEADALASLVVNTSAAEAWARVQHGEFEGTLFASKLARLYFLLGSFDPVPVAAE